MSSYPTFKFNALQRAEDPSEYSLYLAALEWGLIEPIVIEGREDLKSELFWRNRVEPYHHQVSNLITFCRRLPVTLLADDVGLGKTISAGLIASELISRDRVKKILIVCPKLLIPQWGEELETKFGILSSEAIGRKIIKAEPPNGVGAVITTYTSARMYLDDIADSGYQMLILDEAHKLRNLYGVDPTPQVATRFRRALEDRMFKYVLMLTATPIHNRLWDLYSLVDLLSVARGHDNPFGSEGVFARKFIEDQKTQARRLRPESQDEFRSIVYGYMSRVRRADAQLAFPERKVLLKSVDPEPGELELIKLIAEPIQALNRLAQISILQALVSSPDALTAQLNRMAQNKTIPASMASSVRAVVKDMGMTAKLQGLGSLIDNLKKERPEDWRVVIFTGRLETQTTIKAYLEGQGVSCGIINGDSGKKNQETIAQFKATPPRVSAIISTEAGSEGVNLQAANVLVNYDLPWNPMIVEQRIGRIQRLASEHANVTIFNIILKGTFEEYIVGRLMEKLQMASTAIGDVESLLQATGMDEGEDDVTSFEEQIRRLVIESLAGKNVEEATRMAEKSIDEARVELNEEEHNINLMLGGMSDVSVSDPKPPKLSPVVRSMDVHSFVLEAHRSLGAIVSEHGLGMYLIETNGRREIIRFENEGMDPETTSILYAPGTPAFERLVTRMANNALYRIEDLDGGESLEQAKIIAGKWIASFDGTPSEIILDGVFRVFNGDAVLKVRSTVAHDSYERLVVTSCPLDTSQDLGIKGLEPLHGSVSDPSTVGLDEGCLVGRAICDPNIAEFSRFYGERLEYERDASGSDQRKKKKIENDFTVRTTVSLVGFDGSLHRRLKLRVRYELGGANLYQSTLVVIPQSIEVADAPEMGKCEMTDRVVPRECLAMCEISKRQVLKHLLVQSEVSNRVALPEHTITCSFSGKRVLTDEVAISEVSGKPVIATLMMVSEMSGRRAEPTCFGKCAFTASSVLKDELNMSQISERQYRSDEQARSSVTGKTGHRSEFILCAVTGLVLLDAEAEKCEVTGKLVLPGILEQCVVSGKMVLPSELEKSVVSGNNALRKYLVASNVSQTRMLESEAIVSTTGNYCTPTEAKVCDWSGRESHPDDIAVCYLTGVQVHRKYMTRNEPLRIVSVVELLNGISRKAERSDIWPTLTASISKSEGKGQYKIESSEVSPNGSLLAVCVEARTWFGIKTRHLGLLYSIKDDLIKGRVTYGRRENQIWIEDQS